jgi:hypothetical protein
VKELEVKYSLSCYFDDVSIDWINDEIDYLVKAGHGGSNKQLFEKALRYYLGSEDVLYIDEIVDQNLDQIYKWWKENK